MLMGPLRRNSHAREKRPRVSKVKSPCTPQFAVIDAEEDRRRVEERYAIARTRKRTQEEKMELKWEIVAGEVVGCVRRMKRAEFRWHTMSCMEVLRVMQCTK